jgi:hypothetical protein
MSVNRFPTAESNPQTLEDVKRFVRTAQAAKVFTAPSVAALPAAGKPGQVVYNEADDHFYGWRATAGAWAQLDN